ncbi:MAG: invasion-associated locus B family protein [Hyphomicrobiales bacterium]|nr:MAG: invasion-associated locus B family protein [Hyphomicrobiales bacterium]
MILDMKLTKALLVAGAAIFSLSGIAIAQDAAPGAAGPAAWIKVCNVEPKSKKEICLTTQEIRADSGQFLASVAIREIGKDGKKSLIIAVPPGMLIQPGLRLQVDKNKQREIKYGICFPNACYAELNITPDVIAEMKRGNQLTLTTLNQQAKAINFQLTLIGFTSSYDGEAIDPAQLQAQQKKLRDELQKKAEAARQKLIEQQQKATAN